VELGAPLLWVVLFESNAPITDYEPIVSYLPRTPFVHQLDGDVATALSAVWTCLHLPRVASDCFDLSYSHEEKAAHLDLSHSILLVPIAHLRTKGTVAFPRSNLLVVVTPDATVHEAQALTHSWSPLFGVVGYSGLSQQFADACWSRVAELCGAPGVRMHGMPLAPLGHGGPERLSLLHRIRQYSPPDRSVDIGCEPVQSELIHEAIGAALHAHAMSDLEKSNCTESEFADKYSKALKVHRKLSHLAIGAQGAPLRITKRMADDANTPPASLRVASIDQERHAVDILIAHRAIARGGFGMNLPDIPEAAFAALRDFESTFAGATVRPTKLRRALARIGRILGQALSAEQCSAIRLSRSITAFTDFPWGLAILPGDSSPLATCTPIAYRPLTPLTRALQSELMPPPVHYFGDGFRVLIAECLEDGDHLRPFSEGVWRAEAAKLEMESAGKIKARVEIVSCYDDLVLALQDRTLDALVISAHGIPHPTTKAAGIRVGRDDVFNIECQLPPLVFFSACSVWPRSSGAVSVADLALRKGALTVIGTLAPISIFHHATLVARTMLYLLRSLRGDEPEKTLATVVHRVIATNAVIDVLYGSKKLQQWGFTAAPPSNLPPQVDFMLNRASGRLRTGHIYEDTEQVLTEVADAQGPAVGKWIRAALKNTSYIPESIFYVVLGWPELIVLGPRFPEESRIRSELEPRITG
jgi:hypothetical protein